jgi:hypothetical protein
MRDIRKLTILQIGYAYIVNQYNAPNDEITHEISRAYHDMLAAISSLMITVTSISLYARGYIIIDDNHHEHIMICSRLYIIIDNHHEHIMICSRLYHHRLTVTSIS